jgi:hypothetical protein
MANDSRKNRAAAWARIVARAWREPGFKAKLMADPLTALKAAGAAPPAGVTVTVVEDAATLVHVVLPPKPVGALSDEALEKAAGGTCVDVRDPHPIRNR